MDLIFQIAFHICNTNSQACSWTVPVKQTSSAALGDAVRTHCLLLHWLTEVGEHIPVPGKRDYSLPPTYQGQQGLLEHVPVEWDG